MIYKLTITDRVQTGRFATLVLPSSAKLHFDKAKAEPQEIDVPREVAIQLARDGYRVEPNPELAPPAAAAPTSKPQAPIAPATDQEV